MSAMVWDRELGEGSRPGDVMGWSFWGSNASTDEICFSSATRPDLPWAHPTSSFSVYWAFLGGSVART